MVPKSRQIHTGSPHSFTLEIRPLLAFSALIFPSPRGRHLFANALAVRPARYHLGTEEVTLVVVAGRSCRPRCQIPSSREITKRAKPESQIAGKRRRNRHFPAKPITYLRPEALELLGGLDEAP